VDRNPTIYSRNVPTPVPAEPSRAEEIEPPGGYAAMPASAPDPAAGDNAPIAGDVPPMHTPPRSTPMEAWHREPVVSGVGAEMVGFQVDGIDGHVGKIDEATVLAGQGRFVVDTGPWVFGRRVVLPAGAVGRIDRVGRRVYITRTRQQIRDAPEFDLDTPQESRQ
jgi:hypothetical protein